MAWVAGMDSQSLKNRLTASINHLLPHFNISESEFKQFPEPELRRDLGNGYPEWERSIAAYESLSNFFYFPTTSEFEIFNKNSFCHEAGHYLHNMVNPTLQEGCRVFLETGDFPPGSHNLKEMVAEYGNFILGIRYDEPFGEIPYVYKKYFEIYKKRGPEFLPALARMSLDEAKSAGVIEV